MSTRLITRSFPALLVATLPLLTVACTDGGTDPLPGDETGALLDTLGDSSETDTTPAADGVLPDGLVAPDATASVDVSSDLDVQDTADGQEVFDIADTHEVDTAAPPDLTGPDGLDVSDAMDGDTSSPWGTCTVQGQMGVCMEIAQCDGGRVTTPGYCPGPTNIRCCHEPVMTSTCDPSLRVVPTTASFEEAPGSSGCPAGMVRIAGEGFCIDRYEAILMEILQDGSVVPHSPFFNPGTRRVVARSVAGAVPQGYISGTQAAAACAEAGKRLCTDDEWLRACRGPQSFTYPYGNTRQDGVCNDARSPHPVVQYFGTSESWIWSELGHPCISQQADTVDRAGENAGCASADGVFDMMGNLHEWTADPAGTFRGGFYVDTKINGEGCLYRTTAHSSSHWDYSTGFRCCTTVP